VIDRYTRPWVNTLFSDQARFERYLDVELAVLKAYVEEGRVSEADYQKVKAHARVDLDDIQALEVTLKHDVIAFTRSVTKTLGDEKKWFHYGLTSTDVVDTALGLALKTANETIESQCLKLLDTLKALALKHKGVPMMGRTHGIHADVTSAGLKFALWHDTMQRHFSRFQMARQEVEVGKISGAVGSYAHSGIALETAVMTRLGLGVVPISTQVINRDRYAHYLHVLALMASGIEQMALEVRHYQRTEVAEMSEAFSQGQKGSSAMPHKRNPIASENMTGLARLMRGYAGVAYENIALWHERDISHSSVERVIIPDAIALIDTMLGRYEKVLASLVVDAQKMRENIQLTHGVTYAQSVMHALIDQGVSREEAYDRIQPLAFLAYEQKTPFLEVLKTDKWVTRVLSLEQLHACFDPKQALQYEDALFKRLGLIK